MPKLSPESRRVAICAAALLALCLPFLGYIVDDAYISFRYSRNLLLGEGFVYNLGEHVEGYTNFLWVLLLAPVAGSTTAVSLVATVVGLIAAVGSIVTVARFPRELGVADRYPLLSWTAPLITATSLTTVLYATAGLETALFGFLVLRGLLGVYRDKVAGRFGWSSAWFLLAALTRPEGCLFFAAAALYRVAGESIGRTARTGSWWRWIAVFVVPGSVYFAWRYHYFGELLPNTFTAKSGDLREALTLGSDYVLAYCRRTLPLTAALTVLAPLSWLAPKPGRGFLIATTALLAVFTLYIIVAGGDWMPENRFFYPAVPLWALLFQEGLRQLVARAIPEPRRRTVIIAALGTVVIAQAARYGVAMPKRVAGYQRWDRQALLIGNWLVANGKPDASLSLGDIGQIGWITDYEIVDMLGLVTKEVSHLPGGYTRKDPEATAAHIMRVQPDYVLTINKGRTRYSRPRPIPKMQKALAKRSDFLATYRLLLDHRIKKNRYWAVLRNVNTTEASRLSPAVPGDFADSRFDHWVATGDAFGTQPTSNGKLDERIWGMEGTRSAASIHGAVGTLASTPFELRLPTLRFVVATTAVSNDLAVELVVGDQVVRTATGDGLGTPSFVHWDITEFTGQTAVVRVRDAAPAHGATIAADMFRQQ